MRERARLYAELEFAKWLVHGHEAARPEIVEDAVGLLEALAEGVAGDELVPDDALGLDHAIALLGRTPESAPPASDTSMQTDAYDPEELSLWVNLDDAPESADAAASRPGARRHLDRSDRHPGVRRTRSRRRTPDGADHRRSLRTRVG